MPSPRALLALLIVGGLCLAATCGWLGYRFAEAFLGGSDAHPESRRSALEEVKRLRQGMKAQQAGARSATAAAATHAVGGVAPAKSDRAACGPAAPASPGGALPYMLGQLTQGRSAEEVTQMLERARIELERSSEKKDEL